MARNVVQILIDGVDQTSPIISQIQGEVDQLESEIKNVPDLDIDTQNIVRQMQNAEGAVQDLSGSFDRAEANATESLQGVEQEAEGTTSRISEMFSNLDLGALGLGAVGAGATQVFSDVEASAADLQAQLNLSRDQAEELRSVAIDVYSNNFAGSVGEATEAVALLNQVTGEQGSALQGLTEDVFRVSDAFDVGINEVVDAARANASSMGISFEESLDLITSGFQSGLNVSDDWLDTVREFSPSFNRIGADGGQMMAILQEGLQLGIRDTDRMADAINEFGILVQEVDNQSLLDLAKAITGSEAEAKKLVKTWQTDFAKGGESAAKVTNDIINSLYEVEDPLLQNQIGVGLFGSMWEDTSGKVGQAILNAQNKTIDYTNATASLDAQYDTTMGKLQAFGRSLLGDVMGPLQTLGPIANSVAQGFTALGTTLFALQGFGVNVGAIFGRIGTLFKNFGSGIMNVFRSIIPFITRLGPLLTQLGSWFMTAARIGVTAIRMVGTAFLTNPIGLVITAIIAALTLLIMNWEHVKTFLIATWNVISNAAITVWGYIQTFLSTVWNAIRTIATTVFNAVVSFFSTTWNTIRTVATTVWNAIKAFFQTTWNNLRNIAMTVWNAVASFFSSIWSTIQNVFSTVLSWIANYLTARFNTMREGVSRIMNGIRSIISSVWGIIRSIFSGAVAFVQALISGDFSSMRDIVRNTMNNIRSHVRGIWNGIKSFLSGISLYSIGRDIIDGLLNGISSMASAVWDKVTEIANGVKDTIANILNIGSPSKVLEEQGKDTGQGFINGIASMVRGVINASREMAQAAVVSTEAMFDPVQSAQYQFAGDGQSSEYYEFHITVNANDERGGREAGRAFVSELNRRGWRKKR